LQKQIAADLSAAGKKGGHGLATGVGYGLDKVESGAKKAGDDLEAGMRRGAIAAELVGKALEKAMELGAAAAERYAAVNQKQLAPAFAQLNSSVDDFLSRMGGEGGLNAAISQAAGEVAQLTRESDDLAVSLGQSLSGAIVAVTEALKGLKVASEVIPFGEIAAAVNPLSGFMKAYAAEAKLAADATKLLAEAGVEVDKSKLAANWGILGTIFSSTQAGLKGVASAATKKKPEGKGGAAKKQTPEEEFAAILAPYDKAMAAYDEARALGDAVLGEFAEEEARKAEQLATQEQMVAEAHQRRLEQEAALAEGIKAIQMKSAEDAAAAFERQLARTQAALAPFTAVVGAAWGKLLSNIEQGQKLFAGLGATIKGALAGVLKEYGKEWALKAGAETAAGIAATASIVLSPTAPGHFTAAGIYAAMAAGAGVGGALLGRSGGRGGAGVGAGAGGGASAAPSLGRAAASSTQPPPGITIDMRGAILPTSSLTDAQLFGEALAGYIAAALAGSTPNARRLLPGNSGFVK
jgi:hypothetical protein